ncbi:MAG: penicillin acylase family protein [Acidobacteria bacterium]|nr:penicillin acylase family protein [Acidobacteriota bacterium]
MLGTVMRRLTLACSLLLLSCGGGEPAPESADSLRRLSSERLAQLEGSADIPGLQAPVEILRDEYGVAHIYAQNQHDLFFAQGYVAAQDRLYQIEIWRRTGAGELAEVFGPDYVDRDRIARLVRYRGDLDAEWASYGPQSRQIAEAFTSGVNAWVDAHRDRLPVEFELLDFEPGRWKAEDVLLRIAGLLMVRNISQEIARAEMVAKLGVEMTEKYFPTDPVVSLKPDPDLDLAGIDAAVTAAYREAVSIPELEQAQGSNNWVVAGRLSETGSPLLASDPHRPVILPSLRYLVHLNAPGWNVIGSGEPALPGVAIGHNERIGWGFTIVQYDLADLFIEQLNPANPDEYRVGEGFQPFEVEKETVAVRGGEPVEVELRFSRRGPIIWSDPAGGRVAALRWAGQEPGTAGYLGSLALDQAQNWDGFVTAMRAWKVPSENIVYADVDGHIGWIPAGLLPIRQGWRGLLPMPGWKDEYQWTGFRTVDQLPRIADPAQGYVATANHNIRPKDYPYDLGFDWSNPYRFRRIDEVLAAGEKFSIADFQKLQHDETSLPARALVGMLGELPEGGAAAEARAMLADWDLVLDKDSAAAALFELWVRKLPGKYVMSQVPPAAQGLVERNLMTPELIAGLARISDSERRLVLLETLDEAWQEARKLLGEQSSGWRWGALHNIEFRHPLANTAARRQVFNVGPFERGGDANTPNATPGPGFSQSSGASYRHILDVSDWDRSVYTSTPGQSGMPGSPHYADLAPRWAGHEYQPLPFSRQAVEAATQHKLVLQPAP